MYVYTMLYVSPKLVLHQILTSCLQRRKAGCADTENIAMTVTRRQICEVVKHIVDLAKRPNVFMENDQERKTESITHTRQHCMSSVS